MNIIDRLKNLGRRLVGRPELAATELDVGRYYPSTSRHRKAEAKAAARYSHVSAPILTNDPDTVAQMARLGMYLPERYVERGKGVTVGSPSGYLKREADRLAKEMGWNNKQRIKLRGRMAARAAELAAVG